MTETTNPDLLVGLEKLKGVLAASQSMTGVVRDVQKQIQTRRRDTRESCAFKICSCTEDLASSAESDHRREGE